MEAPEIRFRESCIKVSLDDLEDIVEENRYLKEQIGYIKKYYDGIEQDCLNIIDSKETVEEKYKKLEGWLHQFRRVTFEIIKGVTIPSPR